MVLHVTVGCFSSVLYFTLIYNVHLKISNSSINNMFTRSINNMFTHQLKSTESKCRDRFRIPSNIKTSFKGNNPVNNFAKFSASEVWQSPEVIWETFNVNYTKYFWLTKNIFNNYFVIFFGEWWHFKIFSLSELIWISFALKVLRTCPAPVSTLHTYNFNAPTYASYLFLMNYKNWLFQVYKCFTGLIFSRNVSLTLICLSNIIIFIFRWFLLEATTL